MSQGPIRSGLQQLMIKDVPSYANKFFYSLGFLSMISFVLLLVTGIAMSAFGPDWWLINDLGKFVRSVHMWATQAFVIFIILHLLVVFFTSGFKPPRRLTWVIGVLMLFIVLAESEFGYALRNDFSSQWRSLQGADFYNGAGIGYWLNPLNYHQIYGVHIAVVPFVLVALLGGHYFLVRVLGIAKSYRADQPARTVPADHTKLFIRGGTLVALVIMLAVFYPSPFLKPTTIAEIAQKDPQLMTKTLAGEFDGSSDTAGYKDNISPYTFDSRQVFIDGPYAQLVAANPGMTDSLKAFNQLSDEEQKAQLTAMTDYYAAESTDGKSVPKGQAADVVDQLTTMASAGLYEPAVGAANARATGDQTTYTLRFLADTGVLEDRAKNINMTTEQYGMLHEESSKAPAVWWLAPIGVLNHTVLANDENGDRDAALIFGSFLIIMLAFPYIPYLNQLPDKLKVYKLIWREKK